MLWLTMIVRNEAPRMLRALASAVAGGVQRAVVLDTGSTDGTREAAAQAAAALSLPLTWHTGPFRDFAQARNLALDHLLREARRQRIAAGDLCVLSLDADEELACPLADLLAMAPRADGYLLPVHAPGESAPVLKVLRTSRAWRYRGVVHEAAESPKAELLTLERARVLSHFDGSRSADRSATLRADAGLLLRHLDGLKAWSDDPRAVTYLGRTLEALGETSLAAEVYLYRSEMMAGYEEERWWATYRAGKLFAAEAPTLAERLLWRAVVTRPHRFEPLRELAKLGRPVGNYLAGCEARPGDLFAETPLADDYQRIAASWGPDVGSEVIR